MPYVLITLWYKRANHRSSSKYFLVPWYIKDTLTLPFSGRYSSREGRGVTNFRLELPQGPWSAENSVWIYLNALKISVGSKRCVESWNETFRAENIFNRFSNFICLVDWWLMIGATNKFTRNCVHIGILVPLGNFKNAHSAHFEFCHICWWSLPTLQVKAILPSF